MKNKILATGALTISLIFVGSTYAFGQNDAHVTGSQVQQQTKQQTQTINQDETNQIKTGVQTQQKLQDVNGEDNQVQSQNQIKNQGEANQIKTGEQQNTQSSSTVAQQRRSQVANAVQEMLQVADRNDEIGQQVRVIAQTQNQNQEKIETSLQKVQNRSSLVKFFVGPNYGEINSAKKILEQNRAQIEELNQVKNQLVNQDDQQAITQQIQTLEQTNLEIENSLGKAQKGFSLFGWMFKLFFK